MIKYDNSKIFQYIDIFIFSLLLVFLFLIIIFSSKANIQSDSIDYYAILQRITRDTGNPIVRNLHFVEQRSPGYPLIATIPYYLASSTTARFIKTENITQPHTEEIKSPREQGSEQMLLPAKPILSKDIFFKNFYIERENSWFEWKIISALLFTSYFLFFVGILFIAKTLLLENKSASVFSLIPLTIITSRIFMHNIANTPVYATLAAFGISSIFCYFFIKSFVHKSPLSQFFTGLFLGILMLTRLEVVIIFGVLFLLLIFAKEKGYLKNLILGSCISLFILLIYNFFQFGTIFHFGILQGDINKLGLNVGYIFANIFSPKSGIIFWSPLVSLGIIGLFLGNKKHLKILGTCSISLIALLLIRVPIMYNCIGSEPINIGGLLITCPQNMDQALMLVRSDINRYIIILVPFAVLGLQNLLILFKKGI